jgi:hypothetical protein
MESGNTPVTGVTFDHMAADYLADYELQQYRTIDSVVSRQVVETHRHRP